VTALVEKLKRPVVKKCLETGGRAECVLTRRCDFETWLIPNKTGIIEPATQEMKWKDKIL